jgi:hypothetical protein
VLKTVFGNKMEATERWRKCLREDFHSLYCSPNINRKIKLKNTRWMEHVACAEEMKNAYKMLIGKTGEESIWKSPV